MGAFVPYTLVAAIFHGGSLSEAFYWALGPAGPPPGTPILSSYWWSLDLLKNVWAAWSGYAASLLPQEMPFAPVTHGIAAALLVAAMAGVRTRRNAALWIWVVGLNIFQFFFAVGAPRFRLLFLPPLIALALPMLEKAGPELRKRLWLLPLAFLALNATGTALPRMRMPAEGQRTAWLRAELGPRDFLFFVGRGPTSIRNVWLAYFAPELRARSLWGFRFAHPEATAERFKELLAELHKNDDRIWVERGLETDLLFSAYDSGECRDGPGEFGICRIYPRGPRPARRLARPVSLSRVADRLTIRPGDGKSDFQTK